MSSLNEVKLIGRLGHDPEVVNFENGNKLAKLNLATSHFYKDSKGEKVEETDWHSVIFWGKQAELIEKYLKKGSRLYISGKLKTRSFETKEGEKRYRTEVVGREVIFLDSKSQQEIQGPEPGEAEPKDDLPFWLWLS